MEPPAKKSKTVEALGHHRRYEYCRTRVRYRAGRNLTAVKVYSVADESSHLLVFGVPKINLLKEVTAKFRRFGGLASCSIYTDEMVRQKYELEQFTDCYLVKFVSVPDARKAKRYLDATNFYGGLLHISYAPELENIEDTRAKLMRRAQDVSKRVIFAILCLALESSEGILKTRISRVFTIHSCDRLNSV